jgi:hypothetical protein
MKRTLAAICLVAPALLSAPAYATGELTCGNGKDVSIDLLVGHVDVLSISRLVVRVGDKTWSSTPDSFPGQPILVGQAFEDDKHLLLDITDEAVNEVVGRLRVVKLQEGESRVSAGVLGMKGVGAWAVECSEGE